MQTAGGGLGGVERTGEDTAQGEGHQWLDFSFVASSGYREKVLRSLAEKPKFPGQLARETNLRLFHVSRTLRELKDRGLAYCLTPMLKARGRLYDLTKEGSSLASYLTNSSQRLIPLGQEPVTTGFVPKMRASSLCRCVEYLKTARGEAAVKEAFGKWTIDVDQLTDSAWVSVDAYTEFLELAEAHFGNGSYDFIRALYSRTIASVPTVRDQILKVIPLEALAERAPIVYGRVFNYGRLEVETGKRRAAFLHYDWMPTPAMCTMFQGIYEGILHARRVNGMVTKTKCVRVGDDHCEYLVEW